jgi:hypothetical protein
MSKTALLDALNAFDVEGVRAILKAKPELKGFSDEKGYNLLQLCCKRGTYAKPDAAGRQLRLARWFVEQGFDPTIVYTTEPGDDGEEEPARVSLAWFAVAKARNTALARYFLERGAAPGALFAAAWWGNADILPDLVKHGADVNEVVGATPLHMAVDVATRGTDGKPRLARERLNVVTELLRLGADPNLAAFDGTTPLHTALKKEYLDVFRVLLEHGANPDVPGRDGRTVREIASRKRDKRFESLIPNP